MKRFWQAVGLVALSLGVGLLAIGQSSRASAQAAPTLKVTAPAEGATVSSPVSVTIESSGATIKAATDGDAGAAHFHYFVDRDPATVVRQGQPIPTGQPDIIHTAATTQAIPDLSPGKHTVWVVLAHTDHTPYNPSVEARVSFTVGAAGQAAPAAAQPSAGRLPATGNDLAQTARLALVSGLLLLAAGYALLRRTAHER